LTGQSAGRVKSDFNAASGGDFENRVGSRADHELVGDYGYAYSLQNGGSIEHVGNAKTLRKH
jgi:hypothetical protein